MMCILYYNCLKYLYKRELKYKKVRDSVST